MKILYFYVAPLPLLRHRDFFVVDAFAAKNCFYIGTAVTRRYATYTFELRNSAYTSWSWSRPH